MPLNEVQLKQLISSVTNASLQYTIKTIKTHVYCKPNEDASISAINKLLINAKTRTNGLEIILETCHIFSQSALSENSLKWTGYCLIQHENDSTKEAKLKLLASILDCTQNIDSFSKKFLADHLSEVVKMCTSSLTNSENLAALRVLSRAEKRFPTWFGNHRARIEAHTLKFLDSDEQLATEAACVFLYLQQTGGGGVEGVNHVNNYAVQFKRVCATIHLLYDKLFEDLVEINDFTSLEMNAFIFPQIPSSFTKGDINKLVYTRLVGALIFLKIMISKGFPVYKQITPLLVIDVIKRGLAVHICASNGELTTEMNNLSQLVDGVQGEIMKLFRYFTKLHLVNVLPFTYSINKMLLNVLKRIQSCKCYNRNEMYKTETRKSLNLWLQLSQNWNQRQLQETLITILMQFILLPKEKIHLNLSVPIKKGKGKGKHKPNINTTESELNNSIQSNEELNDDLVKEKNCFFALEILESLLTNCKLMIADKLWQEFIFNITSIIVNLQTETVSKLYTNIKCRTKLYRVFIAFYNQMHRSLPPLQLSTIILQSGQHSSVPSIAQICRNGLALLERIGQPTCPSLEFPREKEVALKSSEIQLHLDENDYFDNTIDLETDSSNGLNNESIGVTQKTNISECLTQVMPSKNVIVLDEIVIKPSGDLVNGSTNGLNKKSDNECDEIIVMIDDNEPVLSNSTGKIDEDGSPPKKKGRNDSEAISEKNSQEINDWVQNFRCEFQE